MAGCIGMVLYFRESTKMEAAFGLSVTLTMLMSTILINFYLHAKRVALHLGCTDHRHLPGYRDSVSSLPICRRYSEGGWITLLIGAGFFLIMYIWHKGRAIKRKLVKLVPVENYVDLLKRLSTDEHIPKYATNLVLSHCQRQFPQDREHCHRIHPAQGPKRADVYWFVHINVLDEPYAMRYHVHTIVKNDVYFVEFNLGFRIDPRIDFYFRQVVEDLVKTNEVDVSERYEKITRTARSATSGSWCWILS